jgi:ATP-dependent Lhr-like helicase
VAEPASNRRTAMASSAVLVMLEIGRESVYGEAADALPAEAPAELVMEAMG